jgi:hypothetical protein
MTILRRPTMTLRRSYHDLSGCSLFLQRCYLTNHNRRKWCLPFGVLSSVYHIVQTGASYLQIAKAVTSIFLASFCASACLQSVQFQFKPIFVVDEVKPDESDQHLYVRSCLKFGSKWKIIFETQDIYIIAKIVPEAYYKRDILGTVVAISSYSLLSLRSVVVPAWMS